MTIELEGFRRFEQLACVDVAGEVVAIVGPNEAGKSSFLKAMIALNPDVVFEDRDKTRGTDTTTLVKAAYVLDDEDREAIAEIEGGAKVRWWTYYIQGGNRYFSLHPRPQRDLSRRHGLASVVTKTEQKAWLGIFEVEHDEVFRNHLDETLAALSSEQEDLSDDEKERINQFGLSLVNALDTAMSQHRETINELIEESERLKDVASQLSTYDEGLSPHLKAGRILLELRPQFILFDGEDRDLRGAYDLQAAVLETPAALKNLADLARLNLQELLNSVSSGDGGRRETLLQRANSVLKETFEKSWRQSDITVHLSTQNTVLEIMISSENSSITELQERSDGLRAFVALRSFMEKYDLEQKPILLIDEAETHLHYDAQADLVNLFYEQQLAAKVIYTTHSAGCLPRDLGNGVRVIAPISQKERSGVRNSVWNGKQAGFSPLIYAMGATTFAFLPSRYVLLCEGDTDAMLYPTLFREALKTSDIGFQVAPGLASVAPARMLGLTTEGGRVLFLTDGDDEGIGHRRKLQEQDIQENHIFGLDQYLKGPFQLEDLLEPRIYAEAVNLVLRDFQSVAEDVEAQAFPDTGRVRFVQSWCKKHGINPPQKRAVAQRLLELKAASARTGNDIDILHKKHRRGLKTLHGKMTKQLE